MTSLRDVTTGQFISTAFKTPAQEDFHHVLSEQWDDHWFDQTVNDIRIRLVHTADGYAMLVTDAQQPAKDQQETKESLQLFPRALDAEKIRDDFEFIVELALVTSLRDVTTTALFLLVYCA